MQQVASPASAAGQTSGGLSLAQQRRLQEDLAEARDNANNFQRQLQSMARSRDKLRDETEAAEQREQTLELQQAQSASAASAHAKASQALAQAQAEAQQLRHQMAEVEASREVVQAQLKSLAETLQEREKQLTIEKSIGAVAQTELKAVQQSARGASEAIQAERERCERLTDHLRQVYTPDAQRRLTGQQAISRDTLRDDAPKLTHLDQLRPALNTVGNLVKVCYSLPPAEESPNWHYLASGSSLLGRNERRRTRISANTKRCTDEEPEPQLRIPERQGNPLYMKLHRARDGAPLLDCVLVESTMIQQLVQLMRQYSRGVVGPSRVLASSSSSVAAPASKRQRGNEGQSRGADSFTCGEAFDAWLRTSGHGPSLAAWERLKDCEVLVNPYGLGLDKVCEPDQWLADLRILEEYARPNVFPSLDLESAMGLPHKYIRALLHSELKFVPLDQSFERLVTGEVGAAPMDDGQQEKQPVPAAASARRTSLFPRSSSDDEPSPMAIDGEQTQAPAAPAGAFSSSARPAARRRGGLIVTFTTGSDILPPMAIVHDHSQLLDVDEKVEPKAVFDRLSAEVAALDLQVVPGSYILEVPDAARTPSAPIKKEKEKDKEPRFLYVKTPAGVMGALKYLTENSKLSPRGGFFLTPQFLSVTTPSAERPSLNIRSFVQFRVGGVFLSQLVRQLTDDPTAPLMEVIGVMPEDQPAWCESQSQLIHFSVHVLQRLEDSCGLVSGMPIVTVQVGAEFKYCRDHDDCTEAELIAQQKSQQLPWQTTGYGFVARFFLIEVTTSLDENNCERLASSMLHESSGAIVQLLLQQIEAIRMLDRK